MPICWMGSSSMIRFSLAELMCIKSSAAATTLFGFMNHWLIHLLRRAASLRTGPCASPDSGAASIAFLALIELFQHALRVLLGPSPKRFPVFPEVPADPAAAEILLGNAQQLLQ